MDDILKEAMRDELQDVFERIEDIIDKYKASVELVYTMSVGYIEDDRGGVQKWNLHYGWNVKDIEEFEKFMTLQAEAYVASEDESSGDMNFLLN